MSDNFLKLPSDESKMARLIYAKDWSETPLGTPSEWPQSLHSALNMCLISNSPICICWGADLIFLYNDAWSKFHGDHYSTALGLPARKIFADNRDTFNSCFKHVISSGEVAEARNQLISFTGGEEFLLDFSFCPIPDEGGSVGGIFCIATEIGEQKELTNTLPSAIVKSSDDAIISKDLNSIITSWNDGAERMFGYTAEEAVGRPITMLFPEDRIDEEEEIIGRIRKGERVEHYETVRRRKDGTLLDVSLNISPVKDSEGSIVGTSVIAQNITQRKQTREKREQLLREIKAERQKLIDIFQNAPSVMAILQGPDHVHEQANELYKQLVGNRDLIGKSVRQAFPEFEGQGFFELLDQVYETGEAYIGNDERVLLKSQKDGTMEEHYMNFVYQPIRDPEGSITGVFAQGVDITERKHAEEELQAVNETLEERVEERTASLLSYQDQLRSLASKLSKAEEHERQRLAAELHDNLGQMLAVGKMQVDLLQMDEFSDNKSSVIEKLEEVMDDALVYTRSLMSELKPPPSLDKEDIRANLKWIAKKMEKHDLEVSIEDVDQKVPLAKEVQTTISQCIRELLFNVVKHTSVNKAYIEIKPEDKHVLISVEDKGTGFDTGKLNSMPRDNGGFGLFNVRERMDLLGGKVEIYSEPGSGTNVVLHIPLKESEQVVPSVYETEDSRVPANDYVKKTGHKIKVLLVDDHQMVREGLRKIIEDQDDMMVIAEAADGEEAVKLSHANSPDIILMDVNMPKMGGIEATQKILSEMSHIRVIGLSLHDDESVKEEMYNVGATAYLTKTEAFEALCATIRGEAMSVT